MYACDKVSRRFYYLQYRVLLDFYVKEKKEM